MKAIKDLVFLPLKAAGRILIGSAGFVMMGAGLFLLDVWGVPVAGIPLFLIGFLLLVRAVF